MLIKVSFLKRLPDGKTRAFITKTMDAPTMTEAVTWASHALRKTRPDVLAQVVGVRVHEITATAALAK